MRQLVMRRPNLDNLPELPALPAGYALRDYRPGDLEPLAGVMRRAFEEEQWTPERFESALITAPGILRTFVIESGGQPVASATAHLSPDYPGVGHVHWVAVDPPHQGKRLGYFVTLAVLHEFKDRGLPAAVLQTDDHRLAAIKTYQNLGFVPDHHHETHWERWAIVADMLAAAGL